MSGSGFGRSGALGKSLYASVADNAGIWADFNGPAGRISSRVEWVSETSIKGSVPAGVGAGVTVSLRLEVRYRRPLLLRRDTKRLAKGVRICLDSD